MLARGRDQRFTDFVHVAAVSDAHWKTKTHTRIAILPVGHRRIDELRVWDDNRDVVVGHDDGTSRSDLPNCAQDTRYFDAITDGDRPLCQNNQTADEIARNILQTETNPDAN